MIYAIYVYICMCIYIYVIDTYMYIYTHIYNSQIVHHNPCFNLFILHNNLFDNQGSEINKNDIFLRFDMSFTKTYIYIYTFSYCLQHCNIYYFVSQCMFSHALHDQVFNLPYRSFSSLSFAVNNVLIEHKATQNFEKYKNLKNIWEYT